MTVSPRIAYLVPLALLIGAAPPLGTLTIAVGNVRNAHGRVHVDVCPEERFLSDAGCPHAAEAPAQPGVTLVTMHDVPAGRYAVQVFHDENGNGEVDRALFGIPKEGVGFSRDAFKGLSSPKWRDAVFDFTGADGRIALKMRYLLGASGPPSR